MSRRRGPRADARGLVLALALACCALPVAGCGERGAVGTAARAAASEPRTLEWDDLLSDVDRQRVFELPEPLHGDEGEDAPPAAQLESGEPNRALDGQHVRLPGFVVPLELDSRGRLVEFLLAPYVGACIHVPAPPPTQLVHVRPREPVEASMWEPYWLEGRIAVRTAQTRLASSAYSVDGGTLARYEY